jgi:hypothetical protein
VHVSIRRVEAPPTRSPWHAVAALTWCAALGWFAFARGRRVPLLGLVDLGVHELGHLVMYLLPISSLLTAAMGSILQCAAPLALAGYFVVVRRDRLAAVVCAAWAATSLQDASVYVADAPFERLELLGGEHDWAFVLGPDGLDRLHQAGGIASVVRGAGVAVLVVAVGVAVWELASPWVNAPRGAGRALPAGRASTRGGRSPST